MSKIYDLIKDNETHTIMADQSVLEAAREMVTTPSSSGCRMVSSTVRLNSGNSSRNSTP